MTRRRALTPIRYSAAVLLLVGGLVACSDDNGTSTELDPLTSIAVSGESLKAVSSEICRVTGTIRNLTGDRRLDVTLHYQAYDDVGEYVGRTALEIRDLAAGETRSFEVTAFFMEGGLTPCASISRFERDQTTVVVG